MGYIAGIGGANVDINGRCDKPLIMNDSNPGELKASLGGVCRNICENLARLGESVKLVSVVGNDINGRNILEGSREAGIDTRHVLMLEGETSSSYISVSDSSGNMVLAMSDMRIIKHLNEELVNRSMDVLCGADLVVCDGNLSRRAVERLVKVCRRPLYLDPVSTTWARELKPYIGYFDTVKPNRMELEELTGCPCDTRENIELACDILRGKGVRQVYVSLGEEGMLLRGLHGTVRMTSRQVKPVNVTGAGDASMAGIIYAARHGMSPEESVSFSMACGIAALMSEETIHPDIGLEMIEKIRKEYIL